MKIKEFTGKTTQEAIDTGLAELGVTIADVHVDVLQEGAKGLFGLFGSKPARVRLTVMEEEREDDQGLSDLLGSFSLNEPQQRKKKEQKSVKAEKPAKADKQPEPKAEPEKKPEKPKAEKSAKADKPKAEKSEKPAEKQEPQDAQTREPKAERAPKAPRAPKQRQTKAAPSEEPKKEYAPMVPAQTFTPTEPPVLHDEATPAGKAQRFLMDVTKLMGVQVDVYVDAPQEDALSIHMIGDTLGILIGRRGETLDALQYLTSLQVNKGRDGYIRVTLDTENYRAKREDSLRRLAQRMANRAQKTGRKVVLEPMNPYERRVLHTALQGSDVVTTHSEGEEPNRRVVITLKNQPERARQDAAEQGDDNAQGDKPAKRRRSRRGRGRRGARREGAVAATEAPRDGSQPWDGSQPQDALASQPDEQSAAASQAPETIADPGAEE